VRDLMDKRFCEKIFVLTTYLLSVAIAAKNEPTRWRSSANSRLVSSTAVSAVAVCFGLLLSSNA